MGNPTPADDVLDWSCMRVLIIHNGAVVVATETVARAAAPMWVFQSSVCRH